MKLRTFLEIYDSTNPRAIVQSNVERSQRSIVAKLKLGILTLKIESGRWKDTPLEYRKCLICKDNTSENEYHFVSNCDALKDIRTEFFVELLDKVGVVPSESEGDLVKQLLDREALKISGRFLKRMYFKRRELLYAGVD